MPHFKEKKRQGRKMFLRQSGAKVLLLSHCVHWGFQRSLPFSLFLQPLIDHLWFRQRSLYWAPPPISAKLDYVYFSFEEISSPYVLRYLFSLSSQDGSKCSTIMGSPYSRNMSIQSHQNITNLTEIFPCWSALAVTCIMVFCNQG